MLRALLLLGALAAAAQPAGDDPPFRAADSSASPRIAAWLNRVAGTMLVAFGVKLAVGK